MKNGMLSPLHQEQQQQKKSGLFNIILEVLATVIRQEKEINNMGKYCVE